MSFIGMNNSKPHFLRAFPVYMANLIFLILSTQTVSFVSVEHVHVVLFLVPLFYWVIHQPAVMPLWFVFLGGLVIDFSLDAVLGLHAFTFVLFYMVLYNIRRIILSQPLLYHFVIYAFAVFVFEAMRWILVSVLLWETLPFYPSLMGFVLNIVVFFPILLVLKGLHRIMSGYGKRY